MAGTLRLVPGSVFTGRVRREVLLIVLASLSLHGLLALAMATVRARPPPARQVPLEVAVIERPVPAPLPAVTPPAQPAALAPRHVDAVRASKAPARQAPPPPSEEAAQVSKILPVIVTGITLGSTSTSGAFAVGVGNTLSGTPPPIAVAPGAVKQFKAGRYANPDDGSEPPAVIFRADLKKFYPREAAQKEFEGDVKLRLLIDGDGSIAKVELLEDPGEGLGEAGVRAIREFRFRPARASGAAVATTITFVLHFLLG